MINQGRRLMESCVPVGQAPILNPYPSSLHLSLMGSSWPQMGLEPHCPPISHTNHGSASPQYLLGCNPFSVQSNGPVLPCTMNVTIMCHLCPINLIQHHIALKPLQTTKEHTRVTQICDIIVRWIFGLASWVKALMAFNSFGK